MELARRSPSYFRVFFFFPRTSEDVKNVVDFRTGASFSSSAHLFFFFFFSFFF
jgi:hypothetical protein